MPSTETDIRKAFNAAAAALNPSSVPADDMLGAVNRLADALALFVAEKVTLAEMADMATASLIYRKTASVGAPEVNSLATLKTDLGLTGTNSGDQSFKLLPFTGVDGSGETPDLTCALTGAPLNAVVAAIIKTSDFSDARSLFAASIAVAAEIEQVSLTDLSTVTFLALLVSK
jgi:hypothetical protein